MLKEPRAAVNVVYFTLFFLAVWAMSLWHFFSWNAPLYFFAHATGQALLETGVLVLLSMLFRHWVLQLFVGGSFVLLMLHFTDFTLLRLMDDSIAYLFRYFFTADLKNIVVAFQAMNVSAAMVVLLAALLLGLPFAGLVLYWLTGRLSAKLKARIIVGRFALFLLGVGSLLLALDVFCPPAMSGLAFEQMQKALPLGTTLVAPKPRILALDKPFGRLREVHLDQMSLSVNERPNIYVFIIETLRKDFVTDEIAPALSAFGRAHTSCNESFSNAATTHVSWFAIFHAMIPFHWTAAQQKGSAPLQILKRLGYKLRVYSAADLALFHMDELLFGKGRTLVDEVREWGKDASLQPWQRDAKCLEAAREALEKPDGREGSVFVFFLDSTHSEYSVPDDFPRKFLPAPERIDYFSVTKDNIEPLKNRYRNAIGYVDSLFGGFVEHLKAQGLYDKAVMAVTGDHGEEFFEEGALFHGTHLNRYQTSVPLFYKCPGRESVAQCTTHIDLFPTLLDAIGVRGCDALWDGRSVFGSERPAYRVAVQHAGAAAPNEFVVERVGGAGRLRLRAKGALLGARELEILEESGVTDLPYELVSATVR